MKTYILAFVSLFSACAIDQGPDTQATDASAEVAAARDWRHVKTVTLGKGQATSYGPTYGLKIQYKGWAASRHAIGLSSRCQIGVATRYKDVGQQELTTKWATTEDACTFTVTNNNILVTDKVEVTLYAHKIVGCPPGEVARPGSCYRMGRCSPRSSPRNCAHLAVARGLNTRLV